MRPASGPQPRPRDQLLGQGQVGGPDPQGGGPQHLGAVGGQGGLDQLDAAPAAQQPGRHLELGDRQRPGDVEGDPGHLEVGPVLVAFHGLAEQGCRRAGVPQASPTALVSSVARNRPGPLGEVEGPHGAV